MKILIYIALYKRTELARMVFENLQFLKEILSMTSDIKLDVFAVCSDPSDEALCREFEFDYHLTENKPLGRKMNRGLKSLMSKDFDYLMQCGSDDIITLEYFDFIKEELKKGTPYFGAQAYYPYDIHTGEAKYWKYDVNHPIGLGRCVKKTALKKVLEHHELWPDNINMGLDTNSDVYMIRSGFRCKLLDLSKPYLIGMKSGEEMHSFDELPGEPVKIELPIWRSEGLTG